MSKYYISSYYSKTTQSDLIFKNPWIELYQDKIETRNGNTTDYTWYKASDVVVIVPFLNSDSLIMIRQYRYPLRKVPPRISCWAY